MNNKNFNKGFSLVEIILAVALFAIFSSGLVVLVLQSYSASRLGAEETLAVQYATEGIEAVKSIKNQGFSLLLNSLSVGLTTAAGNNWRFGGTDNSYGKYQRVLKVEDVYRDVSKNIVASGGTLDSDTKKITSTVLWNFTSGRNNSVEFVTYLTNFRKSILGNWGTPSLQSSLDLASNGNGIKVFVRGNYAYVARTVGTPNFIIIDISNLALPSVVGSINFGNTPTNVFVSGNYAYLSSGDNAGELQIVNITNPASPTVTGTFDAIGNSNANAVFVSGNIAYLVRDTSVDPELYIINIANPASPSLLGSLNLNGNIRAVTLLDTYAYIASTDNNQEFQVVNISNSASPSLTGFLGLTGNNDALSIKGFGSTIVVGRAGGSVNTINVSNPALPSLLGTFAVGGDVNDISLGNSNNYAFLATTQGTADFRVVDISNPASMVSIGTVNLSATQNGVYYDSILDRAFLVGNANNAEFSIIQPN